MMSLLGKMDEEEEFMVIAHTEIYLLYRRKKKISLPQKENDGSGLGFCKVHGTAMFFFIHFITCRNKKKCICK